MFRSAPLAARKQAIEALDFLSAPGVPSPISNCKDTECTFIWNSIIWVYCLVFSPFFFSKGDNFCDFMFASLDYKTFKKKSSLKQRIGSLDATKFFLWSIFSLINNRGKMKIKESLQGHKKSHQESCNVQFSVYNNICNVVCSRQLPSKV